MSIRTTVTLDDDVVAKLKHESKVRAIPFRQMLNEAVRQGLMAPKPQTKARLDLKARDMGLRPGLSYDSISTLLTIAEGEDYK